MSEESQVAPELLEQVKALKHLTTTHNILTGTTHPYREFKNVIDSVAFVLSLHEQLLGEILKHPEVDKVPDMVPILEQRKKELEAKDGASKI